MSEPELVETQEVVVVTDRRRPVENPYRRPFLILVVAVCLGLLASSASSWLTWDVAHDTNTIVTDINFRNSPENRAAQKDLLEQVIGRLDCNTRKAFEDALNDISQDNPGLVIDVDISKSACKSFDTTTTTSTP